MRSLLLALCLSFSASLAHAMGIGLNLARAAADADLIVHCEILDVAALKEDTFSKAATAKVLASAKGGEPGQVLRLLFDNGYACPNIIYRKGEEALVFLRRNASGNYVTMNLYCGKFQVQNGVARNVYVLSPKPGERRDYPIDEALQMLREAVAAAEQARR